MYNFPPHLRRDLTLLRIHYQMNTHDVFLPGCVQTLLLPKVFLATSEDFGNESDYFEFLATTFVQRIF